MSENQELSIHVHYWGWKDAWVRFCKDGRVDDTNHVFRNVTKTSLHRLADVCACLQFRNPRTYVQPTDAGWIFHIRQPHDPTPHDYALDRVKES